MPTTAYDIISDQDSVVTVLRETPINLALTLMVENDFTSLPVVDNDGKPDGLISGDSILKGISSFGVGLEQLLAHDVAERAIIYYLDDNIFDILGGIREKPAVLIIDSDGKLTNIITAYDVAEYFRKRAENMMLVEDIETAVKEHIEAAYTNQSGDIDSVALEATMSLILGKRVKPFEKLSLFQYIRLLVHSETWTRYGYNFRMSPDGLENMLQKVRETRNTLAHFESEISKSQHEQLKFAANWLERNPPFFPQSPITISETTDTAPVAPVDEELAPQESRYAKLANYLRGLTEPKIQMSFEEIEEQIGRTLPQSARVHRSWWANDTVSHVQSQQWLEAGWRMASVNLTSGHVTFSRNKEREQMYIKFFSTILDKMRNTDFPLRDANPIGTSWISVYSGQFASFNFSFTRDKRFRVELYIDIRDQDKNKQIFDWLHVHKQQIDNEINEPLSWERLDTRRASRIAIYRGGTITDSDEKLNEIQNWAIPLMFNFHQVLSKYLVEVDKEFNLI